jgi:hypothetical protein
VTWTVRRLEPGYRLVRRHPTRPDTGSLGDAMMPGVVYRGVYIESDVCRAADVLDHHDLDLCDSGGTCPFCAIDQDEPSPAEGGRR